MMAHMNDYTDYPTIGSLCTGYGGLDMGTLAAFDDGRIAWVAETDSHMSALLQQRIPSITNFGDIDSVDWNTVPRVNILTAGFPCQDISAAGKRAGIQKGNRSGLFYRVMDAVRALRPEYVVLENVAALRWKNGGLGEVLAHLAEAGYDVLWTSIRASDIGAPHRRERIFILAYPCGHKPRQHRAHLRVAEQGKRTERRRQGALDVPHPYSGGWLAGRESTGKLETTEAPGESLGRGCALSSTEIQSSEPESDNVFGCSFRHGSGDSGYPLPADSDSVGSDERFSQQQGLEREPRTHRSGYRVASHPVGGRQPQEPSGYRAATLRAGIGAGHRDDLGQDADRAEQLGRGPALLDWGVYEAAIQRWELILGRPAPHPTEPGRTGRPRLSPLFVEWMMGLPEAWVTGDDLALPRSAQLQALGNGVVPQQAAVAVLDLLRERDRIAATSQWRAA